jgi:hypothetical protein
MSKAEIGRIILPKQAGQKSLQDPHLNEKRLGVVACPCHPSHGGKPEIGGPGWPGQKARPYVQNNQSTKGWRYTK